jgi:hypothetical protein
LVPSPNLECFDSFWWSHLFTIFLGLAEIFLVPIFLVGIFWKSRFKMEDNSFRWKYGILFNKYKPEFFWWELVIVLEKTVFVMFIDLTNNFDRHLRIYMAEIILILTYIVESTMKPRLHQKYSQFVFPMYTFELNIQLNEILQMPIVSDICIAYRSHDL